MITIKRLFGIVVFLVVGISSFSQGVIISEQGLTSPNPTSILDLSSNNKGFLPPRLTNTQINAIPNPPPGLTVYNSTVNSLVWFNGTTWVMGSNMDGKSCGTVTYGSKTYTSVVIGTQCWMKENLDIGVAVAGNTNQANNGVIEKYCYNNDPANCNNFGGLYQWGEMMQYSVVPGSRGICPDGWHIPTDEEWKILEGYVDSQYSVGDPIWNSVGWRGNDAGSRLKTTSGWITNNGTNAFGFSALPAGYRLPNGSFSSLNSYGSFWSSSEFATNTSYYRSLFHFFANIERNDSNKLYGYSVRCARD